MAQIERWSRTLAEMAARQQELIAGGHWQSGPSDFLSVLQRERDEMAHTRMLAWLLEPTGRHGLGDRFLRRLLKRLQVTEERSPTRGTRASASYWRNGREADIVVRGHDFTLIVEIKVDAGEQPRQCEDLYESFRQDPNPHFLFLTPGGQRPESAFSDVARRAFATISWPEIRRMAQAACDECLRGSPRSRGATVVENYLITLEEQFG